MVELRFHSDFIAALIHGFNLNITAMIAPHPQEVQDETWAAITKAIREATGDGGAVRLSNLVLLAAGRA